MKIRGTGPAAWACTAVPDGAIAHLVDAVAETEAIVTGGGLPFTVLIGLPGSSVRETRDRVRAAVCNSGEPWPAGKVIVSLRPESLHKPGGSLDLAIAVAVMAADGTVPSPPAGQPALFFAELGLDGSLRPVPGALPAALAAAAGGITTVVVAAQNAAEASHAPGVRVIPAGCLADVAAWLRGGPEPPPQAPGRAPVPPGRRPPPVREPRTRMDTPAAPGRREGDEPKPGQRARSRGDGLPRPRMAGHRNQEAT
ncbi:MAG TPA: magnesium chelatase domain-containing protein [Trebonia sp.]|jgi:hypothetical protein